MTDEPHFTLNIIDDSNPPVWILKIERPSGRIVLNPDIPQEQSVMAFVKLCNHWLERSKQDER